MAPSKGQSAPAYVYKIADSPPPDPTPVVLPLSELDEKDGFIHLSDAHQVPVTADLFFKEVQRLWILKISTADMDEQHLKWPDKLTGCAHLYGQDIGKDNVVGIKSWSRSGELHWEDVLRDSWLE